MQAINEANEPEIKLAWDSLERVLGNQFLEEADSRGLAVWEKELKLTPKDTDTLEERRLRIKAIWMMKLPYSLTWLRNWLDGRCGVGNHTENVIDYTLNIQLDCAALSGTHQIAAEIKDILPNIIPANLYWGFKFQLRMEESLRMGGAFASIVRLPIPEAAE